MNNSDNFNFNPYINSQGNHELHESVIAFIDVLGFKNRVQKAKKDGKSQEIFKDYYHTFSNFLNQVDDKFRINGRKDQYITRMFTDCILIGCPVKQNGGGNFIRGANEFDAIFSMLSLLQLEMLNNGYFIRGAVAVDEIYMSNDIIYGNGAIDAYESESKKAKFPRIILTKSSEKMLDEINKGFINQGNKNYINKYLNKDSDGWLFLNYLELIKIGDSEYQFVHELERHRHQLEEKLVEHRDIPIYLEKYIWIARYHNFFCNQPPYYVDCTIDLTEYQIQVV